MSKIVQELTLDKDTKNTKRFTVSDPDGSEALDTVYLKKFAVKQLADGKEVTKIRVTVEAV